jgi:hypothetical protein
MKTCFVIMPFSAAFEPVFSLAIRPAIEALGLQCVRADLQSDFVIMEGIERGIDESLLCIADLTGLNPNVIFEASRAIAKRKPLILVTQDSHGTLPFDLRHFRVHRYGPGETGLRELQTLLKGSIESELQHKKTLAALLEEMILPDSISDSDTRHVIAASPLSWRQARQRGGGYQSLRRTSSDHVGIRGLIYAFGVVSGLEKLPELVDPGDYEPDVCFTAANFYSLGSPKANRWTGMLLSRFNERWKPSFEFRPDASSDDLRDVHVDIHMDGHRWLPAGWPHTKHRYQQDFGLIIRGPHPEHPRAMIMIMAGRGSVGTEAASRAVTEERHLSQIKERLRIHDIDLNDHRHPFWAVVSMERENKPLGETRPETLKVLSADAFEPR